MTYNRKEQEMAGFDIDRIEVTGVAVDTPNPRERDDAFDLILQQDGSYVLLVSIVDVASVVPVGSKEDVYARSLGQSRYMASDDRSMFPPSFVETHLSLRVGAARRTLTAEIHLTAGLEVLGVDIYPSRIKLREALEFEDVDQILADSEHPDHAWWRMCLRVATGIGIVDQSRSTDEIGSDFATTDSNGGRIVSTFMLLANYLLTNYARTAGISILYRNHSPGYFEPIKERIPWYFWQELDINAHAHYARYRLGHEGLGLSEYGHWTSPIRRYNDLVQWRMLLAYLTDSEAPYTDTELDKLALHLSRLSRRYSRGSGKGRLADIEAGEIADLSAKLFSKLIWLLTEGRMQPMPGVSEAIAERIEAGGYTNLDLARILSWEDVIDVRWRDIKSKTIHLLLRSHDEVRSIYNLGTEHTDWPIFEDIQWQEGDVIECSVEYLGICYTSVPFTVWDTGGSVNTARRRALLTLMLQLGGEGLDHTLVGTTRVSSRSRVRETCAEHGFTEPFYMLTLCTEGGGASLGQYVCLAVVDVGSRLLYAQTTQQEEYFDALERGARSLMEVVQNYLRNK